MDEAHEKAKELQYFTEIERLFDGIEVIKKWRKNSLQRELQNIPCDCLSCEKNLHYMMRCHRVVAQGEAEMIKYTCPGCQKQIHKDDFEKHYFKCTDQFLMSQLSRYH